MGYTTEFQGSFDLSPALNPAQVSYLRKFRSTRRVKRDPSVTELLPDPWRSLLGLPLGTDCEFYVGGEEYSYNYREEGILDFNKPPADQPCLWCQWDPSDCGKHLAWDGGEKFYAYVEWLNYMIEKFFTPWGIQISGKVLYQGEEMSDAGTIQIVNGKAVQTAFTP